MRFVEEHTLDQALQYPALIEAIRKVFTHPPTVPPRQHLNYPNPDATVASTLLIMPAWSEGERMGIKLVTVSPENGKYDLPSVQGQYLLLDAVKGNPLLSMDARLLTAKRTAATSALAADFLAPKSASTLLMVGTGALAPELIRAHVVVRPIQRVLIWGRTPAKASAVVAQLEALEVDFEVVEDLESATARADIISCATLAETPLIHGRWLRKGQHLDLVGAYRPDRREVDTEAIQRCTLFADITENAVREGGDFAIPIKEKAMTSSDIKADLYDLCADRHSGRKNELEITCFKSVGHASEDLAAACLIEHYLNLPEHDTTHFQMH